MIGKISVSKGEIYFSKLYFDVFRFENFVDTHNKITLIILIEYLQLGRNALHVLSVFGKENSAPIFDLFLQCMPQYPINKTDSEGSTRKFANVKYLEFLKDLLIS